MKWIVGLLVGMLILGVGSSLYGEGTNETLVAQAGASGSAGTSVDPCAQGYMDAEMVSTEMWTAAGLGGGCLLGGIGCVGVWFLAKSSNPQPPIYKTMNMSPQDQMAYIRCYQTRAREKASSAALIGGTVGVLASAALYYLLVMSVPAE